MSRLIDPGASSLKLARTVLPEQVQFGFQGAEVRRYPTVPRRDLYVPPGVLIGAVFLGV